MPAKTTPMSGLISAARGDPMCISVLTSRLSPGWREEPMTLETLSSANSFGGTQLACRHASRETGTDMVFGIYLPPQAQAGAPLPVLWYLSGLTCTHANVVEKGGFQRICAELGLIFVAPDTSPRGTDVPDDPDYDFGQGAGFYVDAARQPFAANYRMHSYVAEELPDLIAANFPADLGRQAITGHSMGGHGALTLALRHPGRYRGVSAFAPIAAPGRVPWGEKALGRYLGPDRAAWRCHDAVALIEDGARVPEILVDQGTSDSFLERELRPELLEAACREAGIALTLRMREGYDHSYFFVSTFMEDHLRWHWERLST
jgi:S-formylglutathione hydrolase